MIRRIENNASPVILSNGQTITDTDWNSYADAIGFNQSTAERVATHTLKKSSITIPAHGYRANTFILGALAYGITSNTAETLALPFSLPFGYTNFVLMYSALLVFQTSQSTTTGTIRLAQEIELSIGIGGNTQRLALLHTAGGAASGLPWRPSGDLLISAPNNAVTTGYITGYLRPDLYAAAYRDRLLYLNSSLTMKAAATDDYVLTGIAPGHYNGLLSATLYFYSPCDAEKF